jgi:hypothetical protein
MDRRQSIKLMASASLLSGIPVAGAPAEGTVLQETETDTEAIFFNEHETATITVLADMVIPADDRSGSASEAGVVEFIDFNVGDQEELQVPIRGGLAWLDAYCRKQHGTPFVKSDREQREQILDTIAWPSKAAPELSAGVAFFSRFRDLVAAGFWSSKMGVDDLQYSGNVYVQEWIGCPQEVLERLDITE